jgi:iron uptake system component EfeO
MSGRRIAALGAAAVVPLALLQIGCGSGGAATSAAKSSGAGKASSAARTEHQSTLTYDVINLTTWANRLRKTVEAGNLEKARSAYVKARAWLGRIEPVIATMPALESALLESGKESYPWIEQGLWTGGIDDLKAGTEGFHREMERLRLRVEHAGLELGELPALAVDSLSSIGATDPHGKGAHAPSIALIEAAANIEGVRAIFISLGPALAAKPSLREEMKRSFARLFEILGRMEGRTGRFQRPETSAPGTEFSATGARSRAQDAGLVREAKRLAELFSRSSVLPELR